MYFYLIWKLQLDTFDTTKPLTTRCSQQGRNYPTVRDLNQSKQFGFWVTFLIVVPMPLKTEGGQNSIDAHTYTQTSTQ